MKGPSFKPMSVNKSPCTPVKSKPSLTRLSPIKKTRVVSIPTPRLINNSKYTPSSDSKYSKRWADDSDSSDDSEEDWEQKMDEQDETVLYWGNAAARMDQNGVIVPPTLALAELMNECPYQY